MTPRLTTAAVALAAAVATLAAPSAAAAGAVEYPELPSVIDRLAGSDRYETSVAVSKASHPTGASVVYLASGTTFPDALSAAPAAVAQDGPLLLTHPSQLPKAVRSELERLHPHKIVIVGGTTVVTAKLENELRLLAKAVERVAGRDRFATSRAVVEKMFTGPVDTVYLATGTDYPDALSAGAAAGAMGSPVILIDGRTGRIDPQTLALVEKLAPTSVAVVGGTTAIPESIVAQVGSVGRTVVRLGGDDRFETSAMVADTLSGGRTGYVASAQNFPDALVGSALAGAAKRPLYVTLATNLTCPVWHSMARLGITDLTVIGGIKVLTENVAETGCDVAPPTMLPGG